MAEFFELCGVLLAGAVIITGFFILVIRKPIDPDFPWHDDGEDVA